jgi:hypothetical protein
MMLGYDTKATIDFLYENISEVLRKFEIKVGDLKMYLSVRLLSKRNKHCSWIDKRVLYTLSK